MPTNPPPTNQQQQQVINKNREETISLLPSNSQLFGNLTDTNHNTSHMSFAISHSNSSRTCGSRFDAATANHTCRAIQCEAIGQPSSRIGVITVSACHSFGKVNSLHCPSNAPIRHVEGIIMAERQFFFITLLGSLSRLSG